MTDQEVTATSKTFEGPAGNRYTELTALRDEERAGAIRNGLIDDPLKPKALADAQVFVGTCMDMCPQYEREQREFQNDVKRWEINPTTGRIDKDLAVKAFHRPAAGNEQALPSDVRPPRILSKTLNYLVEQIVSTSDPLDKDTHGFVRDRTRSIRQDFTLQNERGAEAIACHERIVRFHILSLHQMCEIEGFDAHQEMEQLRKTLQSLAEYYDDHSKGLVSEAEFRAYHVITRLRDPDVLRHVQTLPRTIRKSSVMKHALKLYQYAQRSNEEIGRFKPPNADGSMNAYSTFFRLVAHPDTSYLMACLCETQFNEVRKGALKSMRKALISAVKAPSAEELVEILGCDDEEEVERQCEQYSVVVQADDSGIRRPVLNKSSLFDETRPDLRQEFSERLVEAKRGGLSFAEIIYGNMARVTIASPRDHKSSFKVSRRVSSSIDRKDSGIDRTFAPLKSEPNVFHIAHQDPSTDKTLMKPQFISREVSNTSFSFKKPLVGSVLSSKVSAPNPKAVTMGVLTETKSASPLNVKSTSNAEPLITDLSIDTVNGLLRGEFNLAFQGAVAKLNQIRQAESDLIAELADDLVVNLIKNQLDSVISLQYAVEWRAKKDRRFAWKKIKNAMTIVQHRRQLELERKEAEQKRKREYEAAFTELQTDQPRHSSRKRVRSRSSFGVNSVAVIQQAKEVAQRFWQPFNLLQMCKDVKTWSEPAPWKLLINLHDSSSLQWFEGKFGTTRGIRSIDEQATGFHIQIVTEPSEKELSDVGALIYQCTHETDLDRKIFLSLVQKIADHSDRCFPIIIISFDSTAKDALILQEMMVPEVLADKKTPVTSCRFVSMSNMEDVTHFEDAVRSMLKDTKPKISPLATERRLARERDARRTLPVVKAPETVARVRPLRSSFYDSIIVHTPLSSPSISNIPVKADIVPPQISALQDSMRKAKSLMAGIIQ